MRPVRRGPSALVGAGVGLAVLVVVAVGAGADRPPLAGDGAWTTPLEVLLGLAGIVLLAVLAMLLRYLPGQPARGRRGSGRSRWWVLGGLVVVALVVWLADVAPPDDTRSGTGGAFGPLAGVDGSSQVPVPVSTAAVVGGVAALGLAVATLAVLLGRRRSGRRSDLGHGGGDAVGPVPRPRTTLPDGPPGAVVLAAWASARAQVVTALDAGTHDPPLQLVRRAAGTELGPPLETLTARYLPVRYGRSAATEDDAEAARRALAEIRRRTGPPA